MVLCTLAGTVDGPMYSQVQLMVLHVCTLAGTVDGPMYSSRYS